MNLTKRQKEILDFIRSYRTDHGISPTQREIRERFDLSSFGTVQKHLKRLEEKGALSRDWNRSRGISPREEPPASRGIPLLGLVAAGRPIEPFPQEESIEVPATLLGKGDHFVLVMNGVKTADGHSAKHPAAGYVGLQLDAVGKQKAAIKFRKVEIRPL